LFPSILDCVILVPGLPGADAQIRIQDSGFMIQQSAVSSLSSSQQTRWQIYCGRKDKSPHKRGS
jgi:hypothetical protein